MLVYNGLGPPEIFRKMLYSLVALTNITFVTLKLCKKYIKAGPRVSPIPCIIIGSDYLRKDLLTYYRPKMYRGVVNPFIARYVLIRAYYNIDWLNIPDRLNISFFIKSKIADPHTKPYNPADMTINRVIRFVISLDSVTFKERFKVHLIASLYKLRAGL